MTVHHHPAAKLSDAEPRTTRLERAMAEAMKAQEGPELLAKITSREFRDAFQAIAVQQRGAATHYDASAIPTMHIGYDPDYPEDKSKQLYHCRIGAAILNPESAKALQAAAAKRGIRFASTPQSDFNSNHWLKAVVISLYANDLDALIQLVNDELIEKIRPDARVTYADVIRVAQEEIGKLFT
jgi:hypothetical protein